MDRARTGWTSWLTGVLVAATVVLWLLHYIHLAADFPHGTPWVDPARITDEGWYAGAAIRHYLSGSWRLQGDFNPAVALPVFPVAAGALFHFTGVSAAALRAMNVSFTGAGLVVMWLLVRRYSTPLAAAGAIFVVACSPFFYAYTRLGILEPLLTLEILLALLAASYTGCGERRWKDAAWAAVTGGFLAAMVLTKTTGVCAYPAVFFLMASRCNYSPLKSVRNIATAVATAGILLCAYLAIVKRTDLMLDFRNLFVINNDRVHASIVLPTLKSMIREGVKTDFTLYVCSAVVVLLVLILSRKTLSPLLLASLTGIIGFGLFITYHGWLMPRYYLTCIPLLAIALALALEQLWHSKIMWARVAAGSCAVAMMVACLSQISTLVKWTLHSDYSYVEAGRTLYRVIDADPEGNRVVLGAYAEQMALLTGEQGVYVNTLYNTIGLREHILAHRPGWLITFDHIDPKEAAALDGLYAMSLVRSAPAFGDDGIHTTMNLYKLTPLP